MAIRKEINVDRDEIINLAERKYNVVIIKDTITLSAKGLKGEIEQPE